MIYDDKCLILLKRLIYIVIFFALISTIAGSIYCFIKMSVMSGFLVLIGGVFSSAIIYVLGMCLVSYLFDIKLIRNKLYNINNDRFCEDLYNEFDKKITNKEWLKNCLWFRNTFKVFHQRKTRRTLMKIMSSFYFFIKTILE